MKKILQGSLLLSSLLLATQVNANEVEAAPQKHWSVGAGAYFFTLSNSENSSADIDFSGFSLAAAYAVNNHFQVRATYFSLEYDDINGFDSDGFDVMAYGGIGFTKQGFRGYGGAGFFTDKWTYYSDKESFSGLQIGGGVGYSWNSVALDFVLNLRQAKKYEDYMFETGTYVALSGNFTVSYLF